MSRNALQTLSVKRKRNEEPPTHLMIERPPSGKRLKSGSPNDPENQNHNPSDEHEKKPINTSGEGTVVWRRLIKIPQGHGLQSTVPPPPETTTRRFHISREQGNVVLLESRVLENGAGTSKEKSDRLGRGKDPTPSNTSSLVVEDQTATIRKRPGAAARAFSKPRLAVRPRRGSNGPSSEVIQQFEKFSNDVEHDEVGEAKASQISPSKVKPIAPKQRFKDRHPEQTTALGIADQDAMDIDTDDYVYDTYVREIIMPDAQGNIPVPRDTIGLIIVTEEDEEWLYDEDESDREFDTDDEDSNAEEFYANDYPEDELASDDEFERDPYSYHHGDEEYDLDEARSDAEDDQPYRQTVPKLRATYWGQQGE